MAARVGVIGLGLIGRQRLSALNDLVGRGCAIEIVGVVDPCLAANPEIAGTAPVVSSVERLVAMRPDWILVATPHDVAVEVVSSVLASGIGVFVEKPLGRDVGEAQQMMSAMQRDGQLRVGYNYRFFDGVKALLHDVAIERFGELVSLEVELGHGGSPDDAKTWKLDPIRAGGGCLIDPGIHVLDLVLKIAGTELEVVGASSWAGFWKTGIEEDVHLLLAGTKVPTVNLHISVVRWRSTFRMELHGTEGYGVVEGRGRSYGPQSYRRGRRWGWQGALTQFDSEEAVCISDCDDAFALELKALLCEEGDSVSLVGTADEAIAGMDLLEKCRMAIRLPEGRPRLTS